MESDTRSLYEDAMIELELRTIRARANDVQELAVLQCDETKDITVTH